MELTQKVYKRIGFTLHLASLANSFATQQADPLIEAMFADKDSRFHLGTQHMLHGRADALNREFPGLFTFTPAEVGATYQNARLTLPERETLGFAAMNALMNTVLDHASAEDKLLGASDRVSLSTISFAVIPTAVRVYNTLARNNPIER